jgi:hypothetical protein
MPAKWQAILEPITPLPNTATFLIERFIIVLFMVKYLPSLAQQN